MREFDQSQSWLDNSGKPLIGRLTFYKLHTSEKATIYNVNGTAIANPQFTNTIGQTVNQVFLDNDIDYTVSYEKYIGNGIMVDDEEPTNWEFQYSNDCTAIKVILEIDTDALQSVNVISDLRNLDPNTVATRGTGKYIELLGYNETLDKPIVYYKWNPTSIAADNGGSIIKVNDISTGRWELVNLFDNNGVDVRHFGVFGAASRSAATDNMSNMIYAASQYAQSIGKCLYFPNLSSLGMTWYKVNNLTLYKSIFEKDTRMFGNVGTNTTITVVGDNANLFVYSDSEYAAHFTINGEIVRTSYAQKSYNLINQTFNPSYKLIIDSPLNNDNSYSFSDIIVDVLVDTEWVTFTDCVINSIKHIGGSCSFAGNIRLTESMIVDGNTIPQSLDIDNNVILDINDWPTTAKWMMLKFKQNPDVIDFDGRDVPNTYKLEWKNNKVIKYKNGWFQSFDAYGKEVTFENCEGSFLIHRTDSAFIMTLKNSEMELFAASGANTLFNEIYLYNSTFNNTHTISVNKIYAENSTIDTGTITCNAEKGVVCKNCILKVVMTTKSISLTDCDVRENITDILNPYIVGCTIHKNIAQAVTSGTTINFTIMNNIFVDSGKHSLSTTVANSVVAGKWIGNSNTTNAHFISLTRTNFKPHETDHTYVYENNTGKNTLQKLSAKWNDNLTALGRNYTRPVAAKSFGLDVEDRAGANVKYWDYSYWGLYNDPSYYLTSFNMFTVGTSSVKIILKACGPDFINGHYYHTFTNALECSQNSGSYTDPLGQTYNMPAALVFAGGYTWKICRAEYFMRTQGEYLIEEFMESGTFNIRFEASPA